MPQLIGPITILVLLILLLLVYKVFNLPTSEELIVIITRYFEIYGYPVLLISAFIEAIPVINIYYPGSSIILLAAALSRQGALNIYMVIFLTTLGFLIAYTINYFIGKHGYYKIFEKFGMKESLDRTAEQVKKKGHFWLGLSYFHPNFGALTATVYGILRLKFKDFLLLSVLSAVLWNIFWGTMAYLGSFAVVGVISNRWLVIIFILAYVAYKIFSVFKNNASKTQNKNLDL